MVSVQTKRWIGSSLLMLWSLLAASCATGRSKRVKRDQTRSLCISSGANQNVQLHMWREKKKSEMIDGLLFILHLGLLLSRSFLPFHKFPTSASSLEDLSTPFSVSSYPSSILNRVYSWSGPEIHQTQPVGSKKSGSGAALYEKILKSYDRTEPEFYNFMTALLLSLC